jgi:serine/threonine protein kinase
VAGQDAKDFIWPDILYTQKKDGEILIEWDNQSNKLNMLTFVDLQEVYPEK